MRSSASLLILLLLSASISGCLVDDDVVDEGKYIVDESELIDPEGPDYCGDFDGDGEPDCPLSGYIPDTNPWWCNSTGIGGHHVDPSYEGMTKGELSSELCEILTYELKDAIEWAAQWPTLGDAEDAGYTMAVEYIEGMGTHHVMLNNFSMTSPDFDAEEPEFPGTRIDGVFEHEKPEFLMYGGEDRESQLVGFAWLVHSPADSPPEGFTGENDWWHRHESLCFRPSDFFMRGADLNDETCENRDGVNVNLEEYWMVHAWIVRPWLTYDDVFTNHHPCLHEDGPEEDLEADCWGESTEHVGHDI
ncbi:MAG: hypothetical protein VX493_03285 [Candidatus Thermoplasmatota archaeon]|jgi:hypothetical protein|nr:hypothetical protein [Euryarchaeota archaeon]MED5452328.1 hypothetical protein [Candidatus Thermoplasmatota archaeon]|tara:strand:- start:6366 stop:7277 length:912 start_codon:yes stop_codon:yes gene_type:complete